MMPLFCWIRQCLFINGKFHWLKSLFFRVSGHDPCRSKECEHSGPGTSHLGLGGEAVLAAFEQSYGHRMESDMGYHGMGVPHFSDNHWLPNCDELTDPGCLFFYVFRRSCGGVSRGGDFAPLRDLSRCFAAGKSCGWLLTSVLLSTFFFFFRCNGVMDPWCS